MVLKQGEGYSGQRELTFVGFPFGILYLAVYLTNHRQQEHAKCHYKLTRGNV